MNFCHSGSGCVLIVHLRLVFLKVNAQVQKLLMAKAVGTVLLSPELCSSYFSFSPDPPSGFFLSPIISIIIFLKSQHCWKEISFLKMIFFFHKFALWDLWVQPRARKLCWKDGVSSLKRKLGCHQIHCLGPYYTGMFPNGKSIATDYQNTCTREQRLQTAFFFLVLKLGLSLTRDLYVVDTHSP